MRQRAKKAEIGEKWRIAPIDGDNVDLGKLKNAKLRFASNADNLNIKQNRQKGVAALQKLDHEKIVDVAGRPELKKKVAKLNSNPRRTEKIRTMAASNGPPKKAVRDKANNFDFRGSDLKLDKARAKSVIARGNVGKTSTKIAKRSVEGSSRRDRAQTKFNQRQSIDRVKEARKSSPAGRTSTPSPQRITIAKDDLKQTATRFKRERYSSPATATPRASQEVAKKSQSWSSKIRDTRQEKTRETLSKRQGADRKTTMGSISPALRERGSTQRVTNDPARTGRYDRANSREIRSERQSRSPQSAKASPWASKYRAYRNKATTPQVQSPRTRSYGEAAKSRGFDRSSYGRAQPQMSRPAMPQRSMSQPQISSPQPSRGGDRSISGRSGGGSSAVKHSMRAMGKSRAKRR